MTGVRFTACVLFLFVMTHHLEARSLDGSCREEQEYLQSNMCCLNCPAGEHVISPCTKAGERGSCAKCNIGTYTEHSNGLRACLTCTKCRSDQEVVRVCTSTQDTDCRCRPGSFCIGDQACEVCKKCKSCKDGEKVVKNCTAHSDTECSKSLSPTSRTWGLWEIPVIVVAAVVAVAAITFGVYKKRRHWLLDRESRSRDDSLEDARGHGSLEDRQNAQNVSVAFPLLRTEATVPTASVTDDDDPGLGSSSSENSLLVQPTYLSTLRPSSQASPLILCPAASPGTPRRPRARNDDDPQLVPLKGEQSLRMCFDYFEKLDFRCWKKFFRSLDLDDNAIEHALDHANRHNPPDGIHDLLVRWLEKEGRDASLNHLLTKLRALDQNRTADYIMKEAINNGHYELKVEKEVDSTSNLLAQE